MKKIIAGLILSFFFVPGVLLAEPAHGVDSIRLAAALATQTTHGMDAYLSAPDEYGTPLIIKLARQGDVKTLQSLTQYPAEGKFLLVTDRYGNNLFHVAKNADTVQVIASLIRRYYGAKAPRKIEQLADARNQMGETPLHAQINAAHSDTFRPIYAYTSLKKKNNVARTQLSRLHGMDERILAQHKAIYCQGIVSAGSANGITLLQAAQAQTAYNPQMAQVANTIRRILPCLVQN